MSLNARLRPQDTSRLYNPNRDVAHNFSWIMTQVAARLEDGPWTPVSDYLKHSGTTTEQLGRVCQVFIHFVAGATDRPGETMIECLGRVGWFDLPEPAQVALMAYLGTVIAGVYFQGVREVTLGGEGPCQDMAGMVEAGRLCSRLMTLPRWRRPLARLGEKLRKALRALHGNDTQGSAG